MRKAGRLLRCGLDVLYNAGGAVAAVFMIGILVIIVLQMVARWTDIDFPGATNYAGYCMAAASFLAFAYALNHGAHIRVSLLLSALGDKARWAEIWCFAIGAVTATYFARYALKGTWLSWKLEDVSQGQDAMPLWIPQLSMAVGAVILAICFWDHLIRLVVTGRHGIRTDVSEQSHAE